jgi:DNA-binding SARP family transcriptional activator
MQQHDLEVRLLGGFAITLNGQVLTCLNQSRQQSLLAYLMLHADSPQLRQHIAFRFWPDATEARAYANLRHTLHHLRRSCPALERFLEITPSTLQWRRLASFRLDVAEYETLTTRANETADGDQVCKLLIQAAGLYQGDLLPGCYDDWIIPVRERLSQTHAQMLRRLVDLLAAQDKYQSAIDYATRLRSYDPFRELSYRRLMELYEATGDRAAALRVYHDCQSVLQRELGVEPGPETRAVYERIVNPTAPQMMPVQPSSPVIASVADERLIGRRAEWRRLQNAWQTATPGADPWRSWHRQDTPGRRIGDVGQPAGSPDRAHASLSSRGTTGLRAGGRVAAHRPVSRQTAHAGQGLAHRVGPTVAGTAEHEA